MRTNCENITKRICCRPVIVAGAALLSISAAIAQMSPGGQQQPTSPSQQTMPGSRPEMSPLDQTTSANQQQNDTAQMMDKDFVRKALQGGMAEVQMAQLALQKSNNDDVKQFAQKMVDDHTKLGDQMKEMAQQLHLKPPDSPSSKEKATLIKLQALSGDEFDKAYIKEMVKDHQQDDKEFKQEAKNTPSPGMKEVVTQDEQIISHHLEMIEQIAQKNNIVASK
jgi:putative membrane protein